jgi:hypothetical protein
VTVEELYRQQIRSLSARARLQLATIILKDIPSHAVIDDCEEWSEEDYRDFNRSSWDRIEQADEEPENA